MEELPMPDNIAAYRTDIFLDKSGKYRWVYELPMLRCFFLLFEVWKVLLLSAAVVAVFMMILNLIEGSGAEGILFSLEAAALPLGILLVLSLPAYWIVTRANNGKYTVLFEMDDSGIDHVQIKTDKAKALDRLTAAAGIAAGSPVTAGAGALSASGGSLYSRFSKVRKIKADRKNCRILVNGTLIRNQIYVDEGNYDFVFGYIVSRCPQAKVIR
jgi:hypothetical protein